ncbi:hypothetical protein GMLC_30890 [Geomonas limicola]|uniref:Uncharacterized protein n=1 Tax=Geomonas limicola TaxID=2740186 RepID=A0A6V8NAN8_9BACT|nr:hypothetical protein [Geomonas limicola]GFO69510.1 hypothetical protein GMLC_30890 [Geomonas limicola]
MKLPKQQDARSRYFGKEVAAAALTTAATLLFLGSAFLVAPSSAQSKEIQYLAQEPANPTILQVYYNTQDKREYIYNGQEWVPHDASIDSYVLKKYKKPNVARSNGTTANGTAAESR